MKIAIFSDMFYPELGGIQDAIMLLAKELGNRGHQVLFVVPKYRKRNFKMSKFEQKEIDLGPNVAIYHLSSLPYPNTTQQSRMVIPTGLRFLALKKFQPDVIHTNTFFGVGIEAIFAAKSLGVPLVGTNHLAVSEFRNFIPLAKSLFQKYSRRFVAWYYNHCTFVTSPSQGVFDEMKQDGFCQPHQVLSNPIDTLTFQPMATESEKTHLKQTLGLSPHTFVFAGRFSPEKHIDVLVRALDLVRKQFPDAMLALAGHGTEHQKLERLAQDRGLKENIKFFGTLRKPDLNRLYQASDIFAIASTCETQGLVLMQAFACGLPAVGVKFRALNEYITSQNGLLVEVNNHEQLAASLIDLFEHPEKRALLGKGAYTFVQQFSGENIACAWEKIYIDSFHSLC